jgi:type I restriction enzyme S subunit
MQDLLTKGIDENGNIRSEETHEFKDSPLGRIPVEWEVKKIEQKLERIIDYRGQTPKKVTEGIPLLTAKNVRDGFIEKEPQEFIADSAYNSWMSRGIPEVGDVLFTTEAPMGNVASIPNYRIALAQRLWLYRTCHAKLSTTHACKACTIGL